MASWSGGDDFAVNKVNYSSVFLVLGNNHYVCLLPPQHDHELPRIWLRETNPLFPQLGALVKQTHRQSLFAEDCRRVPLGVPAPPTLRRGSFRPRHAGTGYSAVHRSPTTTPSQLKTTRWGLATPVTHKQSGSKRKLEDNEQSSSRSSGTSAKPQQPLKQKRTRKTPAKTKREKEHLKRDTIKYCKMIAARPPS